MILSVEHLCSREGMDSHGYLQAAKQQMSKLHNGAHRRGREFKMAHNLRVYGAMLNEFRYYDKGAPNYCVDVLAAAHMHDIFIYPYTTKYDLLNAGYRQDTVWYLERMGDRIDLEHFPSVEDYVNHILSFKSKPLALLVAYDYADELCNIRMGDYDQSDFNPDYMSEIAPQYMRLLNAARTF